MNYRGSSVGHGAGSHRRTTGLVKSDEPEAKIMFFATEAISSVCFEQGCFLTRSNGTERISQHAES